MPQPASPFPVNMVRQPTRHRATIPWTLSTRTCQAGDLCLLAWALLGAASPSLSSSLALPFSSFAPRTLHISPRNLVLGLLCLVTWRVILLSVGIYAIRPTRTLPEHFVRAIIALNSCAGVLGLVDLVLGRRAFLWQSITVFWLCAFAALLAWRLLLLSVAGPALLLHPGRAALTAANPTACAPDGERSPSPGRR